MSRYSFSPQLEPQMDEAYLTQLYEGLGYKVVSVRLIKDRMTGRPQGYCFLEFESECCRFGWVSSPVRQFLI